jgi:hypothetical protein
LKFKAPYKSLPGPGNRTYYTPILEVQISLPAKNSPRTRKFEAVIDSGANKCTFRADIGRFLGLDIESGEKEYSLGIGGPGNVSYSHPITLYIPGGSVQIHAAFSETLPVGGLLGIDGFFEYFRIAFEPAILECHLERIYKA